MNKHQFKIWLEKDHFACFPNVKTFFNKMDEEERKRVYRKWYDILKPYDEGWAIKASSLLMEEPDDLYPQDHPGRIAVHCRRLQPKARDETLEALDSITEEDREELKKWPQLYPHIAKMLAELGEMKEIINLERSRITSDGLLQEFDEEAKERLDKTAEFLSNECHKYWLEIEANRNPSKSPPVKTSQPHLTTDTPLDDSAAESHPGASMTVMDVESLQKSLIDLDGQEDIAF